jgi:20S proteasome alpha/beta subunit
MSLIITLYAPEGIVIAGDSRLTLSWKTKINEIEHLHSISASDSNAKIFSIKDKFGLGTYGAADIKGIPISGFINQFKEEKVTDDTSIDQMPQLLLDFFGEKFEYPNTFFYLIGYKIENGISTPHVYLIDIAAKTYSRLNVQEDTVKYGANWGGEIEILMRILQTVKIKQGDNWLELPDTPIPWNFFTLQDAIDFAMYAVRTTIETIRFQQKEKTVGGPIDILVIKPNEVPLWITKKELKSV